MRRVVCVYSTVLGPCNVSDPNCIDLIACRLCCPENEMFVTEEQMFVRKRGVFHPLCKLEIIMDCNESFSFVCLNPFGIQW